MFLLCIVTEINYIVWLSEQNENSIKLLLCKWEQHIGEHYMSVSSSLYYSYTYMIAVLRINSITGYIYLVFI